MLIALNLATRPFADLRPLLKHMRIAMGALALAAIVLGVVLRVVHRKAYEANAHIHLIDGEIANIVREQQGYEALLNRPGNARIRVETANLNQLFNQKAFSWTLVMEDLETVLPSGVKVTVIEPTLAKNGHITLHVRVLGPRDRSIELVQNLEHSKCFLQPRIVAESADTTMQPNSKLGPPSASTPTDFDLLAEYNANSADEFTTLASVPALPAAPANLTTPRESGLGEHHLLRTGISTPVAHQQLRAGGLQ